MITIDNRPASPLTLLVDDSTWTILSAVELQNTGTPLVYVNPDITYAQFIDSLIFLAQQTLTKTLVMTGQQALDMLPGISQAYANSAVPNGMEFTLQASVAGYNGNANVNKVTFTNTQLASVTTAMLAAATSITLTIVP
jgi:hypothetical protein